MEMGNEKHRRQQFARQARVCVGALLIGGTLLSATTPADAVTSTTDLSSQSPTQLAQMLVGPEVAVSNVTFKGRPAQAGTFSGGASSVGIASGVVLATGAVANAVGPNTVDGMSTKYDGAGDPDISALAQTTTHDASVLEFDFVPKASAIRLDYVFASDEYNESINSSYDDTIGLFVNGTNCAEVDTNFGRAPVSVGTINNGNPYGGGSATNPALYRNNDLDDGGGGINTEYDGLSVVLTCSAPVTNGATNHLKFAIADASDDARDSAVFLKQASFTAPPPVKECREDGLQALPAAGLVSAVVHQVVEPLAGPLAGLVHSLNCTHVVPWEDAVDSLTLPIPLL